MFYVFALLSASLTHADDWLVDLRPCSEPDARASLGQMELVYPQAGLPAVVAAGDQIVARVRVPSGLTPPPGVQSERALARWSASLLGYGTPLDQPVSYVYPLSVTNVRPETGSSLLYRVALRVPAWAAPGAYALRLAAPGGERVAPFAVRVISPSSEPVFGACDPPENLEQLRLASRRLQHMPVDVWIMNLPDAIRRTWAPEPHDTDLAAIVIVDSGSPTFESTVRVPEGTRTLTRCDPMGPPRDSLPITMRGSMAPSLEGEPSSWLHRTDENHLVVQGAATATESRVLTFIVPSDGRATTIAGAEAIWWPASPVGPSGGSPSLVVRITVPPAARVTIDRGERMTSPLSIDWAPRLPAILENITLEARPATGPFVGWELDEGVTAVGARVSHHFQGAGEHSVFVQSISARGIASHASATVVVRRLTSTGCAGCDVSRRPPDPVGLLVFAALCVTICQRRHPSNGNRMPAPHR